MSFLIYILVTILYYPILCELYQARWEYIDYTHAYFVLPLAIVLAWRKKEESRRTRDEGRTTKGEGRETRDEGRNRPSSFIYRPSVVIHHPSSLSIGLLSLVLGLVLYTVGWRYDYLAISTFSLIPVLFGIVLYLYGPKVTRLLAFPILYLLLMVPPPLGILDSITLPMRYGSSIAAEWILKPFFPVVRSGLLLNIEGVQIFMGAPCSGFRSLITMFALALVYAHIIGGSIHKKIVLVLAVIPMALFGNLIRILVLCLITYYFGEAAGQGFFHNFSGILIFVIMIVGLIMIEGSFEEEL